MDITSASTYKQRLRTRAQVVDVGQSNRWLQILEALTSASLGVLFVDAAWAVEESRFWHNLEQLWRTNPCAICLVGFYNPELNSENFSLIRTIPKELQIEFIASTASSAWIAPVEQTGDRMRELLHCSGLFGHSVPVIAREPIDLLDVFDEQGRIPLYTFNIRSNEITRLTLEHGWSHLESDGVWTNAYQGAVTLPVPTIQKMKRLRVSGNCWLHPNHEHQTLSIGIAGTTRAEFKISTGDIQILNIPLEPSDIDAGKLNLTFSVSSPGRPEEFGGEDSRLLGFKLRSVALFD
ncbi:hypothetical protein GT370_06395 [Acidocella sp. MX-AZ03]|uniref:hypothetical protein n=1 Tax=Acidocella sp. MX-AZ03 TaxID=2697363 RepID=UPI0022DDB971|nr:hypothetical protein [Acidocella sp. MX-AZ03]WBO60416.1 hypothetical protein GT370_06395 [Acidocella sp. MX-AZ03]